MSAKQLVKRIEVLKAKQAKLRDEMRELQYDAEQLEMDAGEAVDCLERAADAVSKFV